MTPRRTLTQASTVTLTIYMNVNVDEALWTTNDYYFTFYTCNSFPQRWINSNSYDVRVKGRVWFPWYSIVYEKLTITFYCFKSCNCNTPLKYGSIVWNTSELLDGSQWYISICSMWSFRDDIGIWLSTLWQQRVNYLAVCRIVVWAVIRRSS